MRAGEWPGTRTLQHVMLALSLAWLAGAAQAVYNPESPDRVAAFERRAAPFEQALAATDGGSAATNAGQAYAEFLDAELNATYRLLQSKLEGPARNALVESQRQWMRFRDAERRFIAQQWTVERNGSSAQLSIAGCRNAAVKDRVTQLLRHAAEFR